ncbi:MAG: hypothetical protein JWM33_1606 [Caulobacteraceae bacterium]|nr:hypothetical protein [Caulobacteraceae bacterium]
MEWGQSAFPLPANCQPREGSPEISCNFRQRHKAQNDAVREETIQTNPNLL